METFKPPDVVHASAEVSRGEREGKKVARGWSGRACWRLKRRRRGRSAFRDWDDMTKKAMRPLKGIDRKTSTKGARRPPAGARDAVV